jgi:hypothetical protein
MTLDKTGSGIDLDNLTNPGELDGDHVLVGFMDDNLQAPVILRGIPHPSSDEGNADRAPGRRLKLKVADGDPDFLKHHGSFYGLDGDGGFLADTRFANDGTLNSDGTEKDPGTANGAGNQVFRLPHDAFHKMEIYDVQTDPDNPELKAEIAFDDTGWKVRFVDEETRIQVEPAKITLDVKNGANPVVIIDGQIQLGGTSDKLVTLSGINAELTRLKDLHNALADAVAKIRFPSELFWNPLIPNPAKPLTQWAKAAIDYVTKTNLLLGEEVQEGNAPLDEDAGIGEFVPPIPPDPNNPLRTSGLLPGSSVPGDPGSTLGTIES